MRIPILVVAFGAGSLALAKGGGGHGGGGHSSGGHASSSHSSGGFHSSSGEATHASVASEGLSGGHTATSEGLSVGEHSNSLASFSGLSNFFTGMHFGGANATVPASSGNLLFVPTSHGFVTYTPSSPAMGTAVPETFHPAIPQVLNEDYFSGSGSARSISSTASFTPILDPSGSGSTGAGLHGGFFPFEPSLIPNTAASTYDESIPAAANNDDDDDGLGCDRGYPVRVWPARADAEGMCMDPQMFPHPSVGMGAADWFNYDPGQFPCRHWKIFIVEAHRPVKLIMTRRTPDAPVSEVKVHERGIAGEPWIEKQSYLLPAGSWEPAQTREFLPDGTDMKVVVPEAEYVHLKVCQKAPVSGLF